MYFLIFLLTILIFVDIIESHFTDERGIAMNWCDVGMNIKQVRKKKGLKQKELAELIGFSESSISKYEQGLIQIPNTVLERIAKVLEVPLFEILPWDDEFNSNGKLAKESRIFDEIERVFGKGADDLLMNYVQLNQEGQMKACEYVSDLSINPKYKKEPPSDKTESGSD
nr:MAG TPA: helix-turn-helix domain protein [Caudoviricetes sp.]